MGVMPKKIDPLLGGFYTVTEAARLLRIENKQRIYRWLRSHGDAVILRDYSPIDNLQELSFWDLVEVRFVEHFRKQGLSLQYLRRVADKARRDFKRKHPFALSNAEFMTDRKKIFQRTAEEFGDKKTHDIMSGQYEMYETIEGILAKNMTFNPKTFLAEEWVPLADCPNVIVNPRYAYGHPVIGKKKIPVSALVRLWKAEGNAQRVASWYGVEPSEVEEAVEFDVRLAA